MILLKEKLTNTKHTRSLIIDLTNLKKEETGMNDDFDNYCGCQHLSLIIVFALRIPEVYY